MNPKRLRRLIAITLLGIGIVVLITVLTRDKSPQSQQTQRPIEVRPEDLPPSIEQAPTTKASPITQTSKLNAPPTPGSGDNLNISNIGKGEGFNIQRADPKTGELAQEFTAQEVTPLPNGQLQLTKPVLRYYFKAGRVLVMSADSGTVIAPDNNPQSGTFSGNVQITYFQNPTEQKPDLSANSPHRRLKFKLDDASFDSSISQVTSNSTVELFTPTTKQAYFKGSGLTLRYDQLTGRHGRIDYLEIAKGDYLRFNPEAGKTKTATTEQTPANTTTASTAASASKIAAAPQQFYSLNFTHDITLTTQDQTIKADSLTSYFSMDAGAPKSASADSANTPSEISDTPSTSAPATTDPDTPDAPAIHPDEMPISESDIILKWKGPMIMQPLDELPVALDQAGDMYTAFEGAPIRINLKEGGELQCATIAYRQSSQRVHAAGTDAFPLTVQYPKFGTLTAESIDVDTDTWESNLNGAGSIRAFVDTDNPDTPPMRIYWQQSVDLDFNDPTNPNAGLKQANFHGDVRILSDQFQLDSQHLNAEFAVHETTGNHQLSAVEAREDVLVTFGQDELSDGRVVADRLRVQLEPDEDGEYAPVSIAARGAVSIENDGRTLWAEMVDATLAPPLPSSETVSPAVATDAVETKMDGAEADAPSTLDSLQNELSSVIAMDSVRLQLDKDTTVTAEKLEFDTLTNTAILIGSPVSIQSVNPTTGNVETDLSVLYLKIINDENNATRAICDGGGSLLYTEPPKDNAASNIIKVNWTQRMSFDRGANKIQLYGNVECQLINSPTKTSTLAADQITLDLVDPALGEAITGQPAEKPKSDMSLGLKSNQLREMTARGNVKIKAIEYTDVQHQFVTKRLTLMGDIFLFRKSLNAAQIDGPGKLLYEDYTPSTSNDKEAEPNTAIAGNGTTLFDWNKRFTIDNINTKVTLIGAVRMTHRPATNERNIVDIRCEQLVAELANQPKSDKPDESNSDINPMDMTTTDLNIDYIEASTNVEIDQVKDGKALQNISAHRFFYDGPNKTGILTALPGKRVTIVDYKNPIPNRAKSFKWDMKTGQIEIIDFGTR